MAVTKTRLFRFDVDKMRADMDLKGWLNTDLARAARVNDMTVTRFFRGEHQSARTAQKLAAALGYTPRRYLLASRPIAERASAGR
jgi:transcriptional regulator with XRE-family HTH domain